VRSDLILGETEDDVDVDLEAGGSIDLSRDSFFGNLRHRTCHVSAILSPFDFLHPFYVRQEKRDFSYFTSHPLKLTYSRAKRESISYP
jgi:hypothetical protein